MDNEVPLQTITNHGQYQQNESESSTDAVNGEANQDSGIHQSASHNNTPVQGINPCVLNIDFTKSLANLVSQAHSRSSR